MAEPVESFVACWQATADLQSEAWLLVDGRGVVRAANAHAHRMLARADAVTGRSLSESVDDPPGEVDRFLRQCKRTLSLLPGALTPRGEPRPVACHGGLVRRGGDQGPALLMVKLSPRAHILRHFEALTHEVDHLTAELTRRRRAEEALAEQLALAAVGRDIGLALASSEGLRTMLQCCAEALVGHLGAAMARVWTLAPDEKELRLRASAGQYTHIDGEHARVPVGRFKIGLIAWEQQPHLTNQVIGDPRVHDQAWARREGMVSFAGWPLLIGDRTVGVMALFARHPLSPTTLDALSAVASAVASGIERKRIEADLARQTEILREADHRKNEFLALLAHELRNPIAPIRTGLDLVARGQVDAGLVERMQRQTAHLVRLVDDLLDVARITHGKLTLRCAPVRLRDAVEAACAMADPVLAAEGHALEVELPAADVVVDADHDRLVQVFTNLLINAARYTHSGGHIWIATRASAEAVEVDVRDDGIGLEPANQETLFDFFSQSQTMPGKASTGLGVELALAQRIAQMHDGTLRAHSPGPGRGTTFTVRLPRSASSRRATSKRPQAEAPPTGLKVLIVDDNTDAADTLAMLVEALGDHEVRVVYDATSALRAAREEAPELVLLDLGLPDRSGHEVTRELRLMPTCEATRIVTVSGYGTRADRERSHDAGADLHLVKPVDADSVRKVLSGELTAG